MKKKYTLIIVTVLFAFVTSCKKDNPIIPDSIEEEEEEVIIEKDKTPGEPNYVLFTTAYDGGNINLSWKELDKSRVKALNITYTKNGAQEVINIIDFEEGGLVLENMEVGHEYEFTITATGMNDELSPPYQVSVTPKPFAADLVAEQLEDVISSGLSATVNWTNETRAKVKVLVKVNGSTTYESDLSNKKDGEFIISDLIVPSLVNGELNYTFEVLLIDEYDGTAEVKTNTVTLVRELAETTDWGIEVSSGDADKGNIIDGDLTTFWGAAYSAPTPDDSPDKIDKYPNHYIVIDMKKTMAADEIKLAPRHNHSNGFNKFSLMGSLNGTTYFPILIDQPLNVHLKELQSYAFNLQDLRYVKIVPLDGDDAWRSTNFAEFQIYTYKLK